MKHVVTYLVAAGWTRHTDSYGVARWICPRYGDHYSLDDALQLQYVHDRVILREDAEYEYSGPRTN